MQAILNALSYTKLSTYLYLLISILLGLSCAFLPVPIVLGIVGGTIFLWLIFAKPEIGILTIVVLVSSIIFEESLPMIPIGVGSLQISDIILVLFLSVAIVKRFGFSQTYSKSPLDLALVLFYGVCLLSALMSVKMGTEFTTVIRTLRSVTYYLMFFVVTNYIKSEKQLSSLINGLFFIGCVVSVTMLAQAVVGESVSLMPGRIEKSGTFSEFEALRILPPGQTLLFILFITGVCMKILPRSPFFSRVLGLVPLGVIGVGIILTYNRTYWLAIIIVLSLAYFIVNSLGKRRLLSFLMIGLFSLSLITLYVSNTRGKLNETINAVTERFTSLFAGKKLTTSSSLEDRYLENKYALQKIRSKPILGIGMGKSYRPDVFGNKDELTSYIHNGYFWLLLYSGVVGFSFYFWFYLRFIWRSYRNFKNITEVRYRAILLGFMLAGIGILPMAFLNPIFMQWYSIVVVSTMIGINEVIIRLFSDRKHSIHARSETV